MIQRACRLGGPPGLLVLLLLFSGAGYAQEQVDETARFAREQCRATVKLSRGEDHDLEDKVAAAIASNWCTGWIMGFMDGNHFRETLDYDGRFAGKSVFCLPDEVTVGQVAEVFVQLLDEHPEVLHKRRWTFLAAALTKTFPCEEAAPWQ